MTDQNAEATAPVDATDAASPTVEDADSPAAEGTAQTPIAPVAESDHRDSSLMAKLEHVVSTVKERFSSR